MNTNPRTIKTLRSNEECLVLRFKSKAYRDEAWNLLWTSYDTEPQHFEMRKSHSSGQVDYGRRGSAPGRFVIVKAPTCCSDTWHSTEMRELSSYEGLHDIDRVEYHEIVMVSSEDDNCTPAERARRQAEQDKIPTLVAFGALEERARWQAEHDEKQHFANILAQRTAARTCVMCGKSLGLLQKLFKKDRHQGCKEFVDNKS